MPTTQSPYLLYSVVFVHASRHVIYQDKKLTYLLVVEALNVPCTKALGLTKITYRSRLDRTIGDLLGYYV